MGDRIGEQLGNYRLLRLLGEGGFAEVYLGEHIHLGTNAAIKVLHTQLGSEDVGAFGTEAKTIAHLVHPNIVRVLEFGIEGKTPFLVMDYAPNGTLRQRHMKGSVLASITILPYIKQTAAALQYAHDQKLIHRDIKPENMLMGRTNEILLSDFGIALVAQSSRYQNTQDVVGTVAYMSPEQIQGKPRPSSDQYSLAVVAYEWLSGDRPFHGSFTELCTQHMFATPAPIRAKLPSLSPQVDQVIQTALAKDPHQRFGSIQAFANAFEQAIQPGKAPNISSTPLPPPLQRTEYVGPTPRTEYAPPPPIVDVGYVPYGNPSGYPGSQNYGNPYGHGVSGSYAPGQQLSPNFPARQKINPWRINQQVIVATIIGAILYAVSNYILDLQFVSSYARPNNAFTFPFYYTNIGNVYISISPATILSNLTFVIPLFLAVAYSPWAGIFVAGFVGFLADYFSRYLITYSIGWYWYIGFALMAFLASIALMRARGRGSMSTPGSSVFGWTLLGLVMGGIFISTWDALTYHYANLWWSDFVYSTIIEGTVVMIPLLICVAIYNSSARSNQQRQGYR